MKQGKFTAKERAYLMSLPAVESVTSERIFYAERFKTECMRRYHEGESPTKIFNDAGLYSSLIGYKRIERASRGGAPTSGPAVWAANTRRAT